MKTTRTRAQQDLIAALLDEAAETGYVVLDDLRAVDIEAALTPTTREASQHISSGIRTRAIETIYAAVGR